MPPSPSASSYSLPAKYGGDVTTSATDASATSVMWRLSPTISSSRTLGSLTVESSLSSGGANRA